VPELEPGIDFLEKCSGKRKKERELEKESIERG